MSRVPTASELVGAQPRGSLATVSLAVKAWWDAHGVCADDAVVLACSGGADSLALSVAAADLASRRGVACYGVSVNHGLRCESRDEATRAASILTAWGVRAQAHHYPPSVWAAGLSAEGPEAVARRLRYEVFARVGAAVAARHSGRVFIVLGHTADDQAETVLLRLGRGSGVGSLRAMSPMRPVDSVGRVVVARPLLGVRRADTAGACRQAGLIPIEDPTNALNGLWRTRAGQPLPRSAVRHSVLPALGEALGVDPVGGLVRTAQLAADDDDALNEYARRAYAEATASVRTEVAGRTGSEALGDWDPEATASADAEERGRVVINVQRVTSHPRAVRMRMWHQACLDAGARPSALTSSHVASVDALVSDWHGQGPLSLPGIQVVRKATQLTFYRT